MAAIHLNESPWPNLPPTPLLLIPVGSTEQHGPHLPFCVDTMIAVAVATQVADRLSNHHGYRVVVSPAVAFGASGEHQDFPGTLSIGHEALRLVLIELIRSGALWSERIVFINGHGGNVTTMSEVVATMSDEGHHVAWVACALESATDAHAGFDETSVALALSPDVVQMAEARRGNIQPLAEILPLLMKKGLQPITESGVLGDPSLANAETGERLLEELVASVTARIISGH